MAHRGRDTLRFGPMKPVGLDRSAHRPPAVRGRAAAAGQSRRRSLQPGRIPDADQMGRAGARAAADPGPRAGGVRALRHGAPQHLHQRPDRAARDVADARARPICSSPGRCRGVEGYVESAASGLLAGLNAAALAHGEAPVVARRGRRRSARWRTTSRTPIRAHYQPIEHHVRHHRRRSTFRPGSGRRAERRSQARDVGARARRISTRWSRSHADLRIGRTFAK